VEYWRRPIEVAQTKAVENAGEIRHFAANVRLARLYEDT
jgi:hypothetical protein